MASQMSRYTYIDKVTGANEELLVRSLFDQSYTSPKARKMQMSVDKECEVVINGTDTIKLKPQFGMSIDYNDKAISSLVVKTSGVGIYAVIGY